MIHEFDARGMKCPIPVLKARKIVKTLHPGDALIVLATDPGAPGDFTHFCEVTGHRLAENTEPEPGLFRLRIEIAGSPTAP